MKTEEILPRTETSRQVAMIVNVNTISSCIVAWLVVLYVGSAVFNKLSLHMFVQQQLVEKHMVLRKVEEQWIFPIKATVCAKTPV